VLCIGARNELDTLSAEMLAHALRLEGLAARAEPASALAADQIDRLELQGVAAVCVCSFSPSPATHARYVARRLRRSRPELPLLLAAWQAGEAEAPGEDWTLVASLPEALLRLKAWSAQWPTALPAASVAEFTADPQQQQLARCAQRIVDVFGAASATALLQLPGEPPRCASAGLPSLGLRDAAALLAEGSPLGLVLQQGEALVVSHLERDARFSEYRPLQADGLRFFAGVPLAAPGKAPCGVLALHEPQARTFGRDELRLLERMAAELAGTLDQQAPKVEPAAIDPAGLTPAHAG
jgi:GAF domain-containing protein